MASKINPLKTDEETLNNKEIKENHLQDMQNAVKNFFNILMSDNEKFNAKRAFDVLYNYILTYDRILYSTVSNIIYECNEEGKNKNLFGTILSNVEELVAYTEDSIIMASLIDVAESEEHKRAVYDTQKAVWKIWDHINLAHHQYLVFWQSEDEYDKRFEARIQKFQGKITNEMSSQLLAMIGIFTALAFLIFGSISSLESIFAGISNTPVLKLMLAGCVWGLGLLNLIFVFLFCVGKMTHQDFKSDKGKEASFYQRYPVVCWTDFIIFAMMLLLMWMDYINYNHADSWIKQLVEINPTLISILGFVIIGVVIFITAKWLINKTKQRDGDEDTY